MSSEIFQKFSRISTEKAIPLQASLELTYRCNERCTHCYIEEFKDDPRKILDLKSWYKVLDELRSAGTLYLILMGGEPTLSPYFFEILERGTELGFHVSMISNGLKVKDLDYAYKLKSNGLKNATFSLYSMDPEIHDSMTQVKGSHQKLMNSISFCDQAKIKVSLNGLLTEASAKGIFDIFDWSIKNNYEYKVDPNITAKLNGDLKPTNYRASFDTLIWFYRERAKRWQASLPSPIIEDGDSYICNAAKGKCAVNPYGELLPCIEIRDSFGSLVTQSFKDIWYSENALKWRTPKINNMKSLGEDNLYSFCDHCPGMAKNEIGDPFKMTDYSQLVAKAKKHVFMEFKS
jgi:AdoMet-dependent heme synthase